jgi:sugar (pentulose or hexulose) kinase
MSFIGIDIGGTFLKGAILDSTKSTLGNVIRRPGTDLNLDVNGQATLDPIELMGSVRQLCSDLISRTSHCEGILLTGQMHGCILTDSRGQPTTPIITWRDSLKALSGNEYVRPSDLIRTKLSQEQIKDLGNELRDGLPVSTLVARQSRGGNFSNVTAHSLVSFVAHQLASNTEHPVMHTTDAAAHGLFNVKNMEWDQDVIRALGLEHLKFPEVTSSISPVGISDEFACPVFVAVGDQQASLLGVSLKTNEISLNIATGSQVSRISNGDQKGTQTRPYFHGQLLTTVTHIPAGRALNVLLSLVTELSDVSNDDAWELISKLAEEDDTAPLSLDLSFFPSITGDRGNIRDIFETNLTVGNLFSSASKQMTDIYAEYALLLNGLAEPKSIVLSGGLVSRFKPLETQIRKRFTQATIREYEGEDASLGGLLQIATSL